MLYDVYAVRANSPEPHKGGRKMNATPMTKAECAVFISKFTKHDFRVLVTRPAGAE